ncbi:MAG TPA: TetR/AcrR family transcriptional regulator [Candidatus Binatia bacterium]|nr:TetR/AcrR family transcriptional regulator [Candidatus Binatia bacterium]
MAETVKRRRYDSSGRRNESRQTRQRIIGAARDLIIELGYRATAVSDIAERAGVHVDTVYQLVGRKPVLLRELIEQAISGTDQPVDAEQRGYVRAIRAEPDPAGKLAIYAHAVREVQERLAPLFLALRDASTTEPEAGQVWHQIAERRAANMRLLVNELHEAGGLRRGLSLDEAADTIWVTNSSEVFTMLTAGRGWSPDRYERWLATTWCRLLLREGRTSAVSSGRV